HGFSKQAITLMRSILTAESSEEVQLILDEILLIDEPGIEDWINFYNQPWILASLNQHCSQIDTLTWCLVGETTNVAESAHADINRDGKELSLMNAIE
ncbi:8389_t:CDS:2, partial [Scutellospora calospora]